MKQLFGIFLILALSQIGYSQSLELLENSLAPPQAEIKPVSDKDFCFSLSESLVFPGVKRISSLMGLKFGQSPSNNDNLLGGLNYSGRLAGMGFGCFNKKDQQLCKKFKVKVVSNVTHATCTDQTGALTYSVIPLGNRMNVSQINSLILKNEDDSTVYTHQANGTSGSITNLPVGVYTFSGSVTVNGVFGLPVSVIINSNVWVGIETVWSDKIDMIADPNSYSAKRNASSASFGGVRSSNGINSGDGWIQMSAVFGSVTNSRVYWLLGETSSLGAFSPSSPIQYIEFFKSTGGNGIRLKYMNTNGSYLTTSLSSNPNDTIRLIRTGSILSIQKNNSSSNIFTLPVAYDDPMNIAVRTLQANDGCLNVVSSFSCRSEVYAKVERKLRGVKYQTTGNVLKFYVTEEYQSQSPNLNYKVYSDGDQLNPDLTGTQQAQSVVYGDNRYDLDVQSLTSGNYILEVVNEKEEKFYLRFIKE